MRQVLSLPNETTRSIPTGCELGEVSFDMVFPTSQGSSTKWYFRELMLAQGFESRDTLNCIGRQSYSIPILVHDTHKSLVIRMGLRRLRTKYSPSQTSLDRVQLQKTKTTYSRNSGFEDDKKNVIPTQVVH